MFNETDRQTDRQRQSDTDRQTDRASERDRDRQIYSYLIFIESYGCLTQTDAQRNRPLLGTLLSVCQDQKQRNTRQQA